MTKPAQTNEEQDCSKRLVLLTQKYIQGALSEEDEIKLNLLTKRLRDTTSRVTKADLKALARIKRSIHKL